MGRWWTGYTSISAGRLGIAHSHGEPWRFAATERLQPVYGYGLWKAKIPSEKMCSIAVCGGAGCESLISLYNKLTGVETHTSAEVVRYRAAGLRPLITPLDGARAPWLPGYRGKILDGHCMEASERRLKV